MTYLPRLALLGLAITLGAAASGQQADAREGRPGFEALDTNGDGQLTRAEMQAHHAARFSAADRNGDGAISLEELQAQAAERAQKRAARMMERLDADKDGQISQQEIAQAQQGDRAGRMFERVDANGNGAISKAEFDAARERMRARRQN